jgi:hypothetical protein
MFCLVVVYSWCLVAVSALRWCCCAGDVFMVAVFAGVVLGGCILGAGSLDFGAFGGGVV